MNEELVTFSRLTVKPVRLEHDEALLAMGAA